MSDGERWTRDVLHELRAARFSPHAWHRFLAASFRRAREQRRAHPRAHAQTVALALAGLVGWALVGAVGRAWLAVAGAAWWVLVMLMLDWHLGMLERPDGRTLPHLGVANTVTLIRSAALPILFVLDATGLLVMLAILAALDVADGGVARRLDEETRLGAWLDGSLDGLLAASFVVAALRIDAIPGWLAVLIAARVAFPWLVVSLVYFLSPSPPRASDAMRLPGLAARLPGATAATGLGLALVGEAVGVTIAAAAMAASFALLAITIAAWRSESEIGALAHRFATRRTRSRAESLWFAIASKSRMADRRGTRP